MHRANKGLAMNQRVRAVFLDRDGVLNRAVVRDGKPYPPDSVAELVIDDSVPGALNRLASVGLLLIGVTNQPDVARGTQTRERVEAINQALLDRLPLKEIRVCFHDDADHCNCRKPLPGLMTDAAAEYGIDLSNSFMIGDRWKDIEAGKRAGCRTIWLRTEYTEVWKGPSPDYTVDDLLQAAEIILAVPYPKQTFHAEKML